MGGHFDRKPGGGNREIGAAATGPGEQNIAHRESGCPGLVSVFAKSDGTVTDASQ